MKKLFISISAAFVFLLSCIIPFTASAVYDNRETDVNSFVSHYANDFLNNASAYIFFNFDIQNPDVTTACVIRFTAQDLQTATINYASGILDITNTDVIGFYINNYHNNYTSNAFRALHFDFNSNTGYLIDDNNYTCNFNLNSDAENFHFYNFDTNLDVMRDPIEVEVFPELTDNFNYTASATIAGEDYNMELTSIQVDIINNSGNNYQYAILIQPKNATLSYGLPPNTENPTMFWGNSSVIYALIKDEWVQSPLSFSLDNFIGSTQFNQGAVTINTPSAWHFVGHHSSIREQIYYNQMQLKKGVDYTFKVIGYNITQFSPAEFTDDLPISFSSEFLIANLSLNGEVLYEKNFSVSKDTEYNPDSIANGAYSFDNTSSAGSQFDKIKGFQDSDGTVKILGDKSLNSSNTRIGSNASFNSLISNSTSFLSLMKNVLFYMPDWLSVLLFGGMLAIVLAAIWHKF